MARYRAALWWLCYGLFCVTLGGAGELAKTHGIPAVAAQAQVVRANCESRYEGITYCVEDGSDIHVVIIDLHNPYIRFEMVMADDVTDVDTTHRERIEDMVARPPYRDQGVVVAINADYFGRSHGPEGLTVKEGRRLDADGGRVENPHAVWRSSLAISRDNIASLGRRSAEELADPRAYRERFYSSVGGGPLILNYGVILPNVVACLVEGFPVGACRRTIQTAAGLSEDGRWLYLAVGQGRDIEGFARLLRDYGAYTAIKLDGGGSSQLWYDGSMRHDTDRAVGNALLVFHSSVPRHDARISSTPDFLVVTPGQRFQVSFEIENSGFLAWEPDLGYRFKNVQGWPVLGAAFQRLPQPTAAGEPLRFSLDVVAPQRPGVFESQWQLVRRAEPIGPRLWFGVVVLSPEMAESGWGAQLETRLAQQRARRDFGQRWPGLRQEIDGEIQRQVRTILLAALEDEEPRLGAPFQAGTPAWLLPYLERMPR